MRLGEVCDITSSKRIFAREYRTTGIPFYRGKEIIEKQNGKPISNELFIEEKRFREISEKHGAPQKGDLLLTSVGTLGVPYVVQNEQFYFKDGNITWFRNFRNVISKYIYYWFLSPTGRQQIESKSIGSTQKALTIDALVSFEINVPTIFEQNVVVETLSALDDKIALNTKINRNLEQMAQAIFKSWFVDFEPWGGVMPDDWRVGVLGDICTYNKERISVSELTPSTYISTENMQPDKEGYVDATNLPTINQTTLFREGFVLISNIRPYFKKIVFCDLTGGCSTDVLCFCPNENVPSSFLYNTLYRDQFFEYMVAGSKGTKMPRGDKTQIMQYSIPIPAEDILAQFDDVIMPILRSENERKSENVRLAAIRDALLPRLMSGEIKIPLEV